LSIFGFPILAQSIFGRTFLAKSNIGRFPILASFYFGLAQFWLPNFSFPFLALSKFGCSQFWLPISGRPVLGRFAFGCFPVLAVQFWHSIFLTFQYWPGHFWQLFSFGRPTLVSSLSVPILVTADPVLALPVLAAVFFFLFE
jgi:hypothetical protein